MGKKYKKNLSSEEESTQDMRVILAQGAMLIFSVSFPILIYFKICAMDIYTKIIR